MTSIGFILIIFSAICHATWNYTTKKIKSNTTFIWLFSAISSVIYLPFVLTLLFVYKINFQFFFIFFITGSAALHSAYFILLNKGYRSGNLSVIYPLARGTGPLFSTVIAIVFLKESASPSAIVAILLIISGIVSITGNPALILNSSKDNSLIYAFLCGLTIASYTIFDKIAVSTLMLPPILLDWLVNLGRVLLLTPYALRRRDQLKGLMLYHKKEVLTVAALSPLSYILVLTAMVSTPVYYVAPIRELSILIGTFFGVRFLSEDLTTIKLMGICLMVIGIITLSLA
ncbi:DMT family transporter [Geosporobacter ferrireducens]|uniref:DMT family transporter n=1 Tax=Geosporobacter ferrireducens TaxID=1424294 RepID=UPI00139ADE7B|nr:DMT family transporter [Geosporobacter ferrireducens]MTI57401.1 EamA family transporter [Geosporobacter ferrireducens]